MELRDISGRTYFIDTADPKLAIAWVGEWLPDIAQAVRNTHIPWTIYIYPWDSEESALLGADKTGHRIHMSLTPGGLQELGNVFYDAAQKAGNSDATA